MSRSGDRGHRERFRRLIRTAGPVSLVHFMGESNALYYGARDPLGAAGDFVTAPEVSQMFGELIGLWLVDMWIAAGCPRPVHYVELGPGRGTLAADALRAARSQGLDPEVHLVETSPALEGIQLAAVPDATWHRDLSSVPLDGPILLVANEFLDALPVRQLVRTGDGWCERMVGLQGEDFLFTSGAQPMDAAVPDEWREAEAGTILETCPAAAAILSEISGRLAQQGGCALLIDYGHDAHRTGSTLQAVRAHRKVDPLAYPGDADLTAHVDFATLAGLAYAGGVRNLGTVTQGDWLRALGIETRAANLAAKTPGHSAQIEAALDRLVGEDQMGTLFKVMGLASEAWPGGAGFPVR